MRAEKKLPQKGRIHSGKPGVTGRTHGVAQSKTDPKRHAAESNVIQGKTGSPHDIYRPGTASSDVIMSHSTNPGASRLSDFSQTFLNQDNGEGCLVSIRAGANTNQRPKSFFRSRGLVTTPLTESSPPSRVGHSTRNHPERERRRARRCNGGPHTSTQSVDKVLAWHALTCVPPGTT